MKTKNIIINRYYNKKGNSYATRDLDECISIICKKLKIETNPKTDDRYMEKILLYMNVESQIIQQFDCNLRTLNFKILLK